MILGIYQNSDPLRLTQSSIVTGTKVSTATLSFVCEGSRIVHVLNNLQAVRPIKLCP